MGPWAGIKIQGLGQGLIWLYTSPHLLKLGKNWLSTRGFKKKVACLDFSVKVLLVMDSFEPNRCDVCEDSKITILCYP